MNQITIQRFIESSDKTPKGQVKGKKLSGKRERRTNQYWTDVNRILRKKEKKIRFSSTHRIESQPDEADELLNNIHYANYLGQKDLKFVPHYNSDDSIIISKYKFGENIECEDQISAEEVPVSKLEAGEGEIYNLATTTDRLYMYLPEFRGETRQDEEEDAIYCRDERYLELQRKYMEIIDLHAEYMESLYKYERQIDREMADDDSIKSYQSWY